MIISAVRTTAATAGGESTPILQLVVFGSRAQGYLPGEVTVRRAIGLVVRGLILVTV